MVSRSSSTSFRTRSTPSTGEIKNSPGCRPGEARVSWELPIVVESPGLSPLPLALLARGGGQLGPPMPSASDLHGTCQVWEVREGGDQITAGVQVRMGLLMP